MFCIGTDYILILFPVYYFLGDSVLNFGGFVFVRAVSRVLSSKRNLVSRALICALHSGSCGLSYFISWNRTSYLPVVTLFLVASLTTDS